MKARYAGGRHSRQQEVPEVGEESGADSSKGGDNMVFSSLDGAFG